MQGLAWCRQAAWLTPDRARAYGALFAAACVVSAGFAGAIYLLPALSDPRGRPLPADFDAFWSGARLALAGHASLVYNPPALQAAELVAAQPAPGGGYWPYLYPPVFLLLSLPLGLAPYLPAMAGFALAGYAAFVACLRRLLPAPWPLLPIAAFPAAMINLVIGQNGLLSATCFAAASLLLDRRPLCAGATLGLFAYKPHLALCVPVALAAARRWRALFACAATAAALVLASWAILGSATWAGFFAAAPMLRHVLQNPNVWRTGVSLYAAILLLHGTVALAWAGQIGVALAAMVCVAIVCARRPGPAAEAAVLVCAALLCTPYVMDYDLVCLAIPMAWIAGQAAASGWRPWEKTGLAAIYLYLFPLASRTLNLRLGLPLAPLLLAGLFALVITRAGPPAPAGGVQDSSP